MIKKNIGLTIIGATSYGAKETLRLIETHDKIHLAQVVSHSQAKQKLGEIHQNSTKYQDLITDSEFNIEKLLSYSHKYLLLCLPSEHSAEFIKDNYNKISAENISIIDLSGCCRIKNETLRHSNYPEAKKIGSLLNDFQYGLPEIYAEKIKNAKHISNPGCFATAAILSLYPISNLDIKLISIDGKSGSSGTGKSLQEAFHHPELNNDCFPYKIGNHRHEPEIIENIKTSKSKFELTFCPHVIPISRGMMVTSYVQLSSETSQDTACNLFNTTYKDKSFIRIKEEPVHIKNVVGSNYCDIHLVVKKNVVIISAAIDNLVKGMAGQAIQNINIMSSLSENYGLTQAGLGLT